MKSQTCSECNGQYIKTVNTTTGECISCFPCPRCDDGYTSSVPCGTTIPFGTEIKCVLIQSDPVGFPLASTQTGHLNSLPLSISSKFINIVAPATSTSIVDLTASSSSSTRSSTIIQRDRFDTTKKQKSEKELSLKEWKNSSIYIFGGVFLSAALIVAVIYGISRRKTRKQLQPHPVDDIRPDPTLPVESSSDVVLSQDRETCSIDWTTNRRVAFRRHKNDGTSNNPRSQCGATQGSAEGKSKSSELAVAVPGNLFYIPYFLAEPLGLQ